MNNTLKHIFNFIGLFLVQILLIDQVSFGALDAYINPIIIGSFLFLAPAGWATNRLLIFAFVIGMFLDSFHDTLGMNASALVLLAFLRPSLLRIVSPREGFEYNDRATVFTLKIGKYLIYAGLSFFIYHFAYFLLESLSVRSLGIILLKSVLSSVVAVIFSLLYQYITIKK